MEKNLTNILIIVLTAAIAGAATRYCILGVLFSDSSESMDADIFTFIACIATAGLAIAAIVLIFVQDNFKIAFILSMIMAVIWVLLLVFYFLREDRKGLFWGIFKEAAKLLRKFDIGRALYYISLSGSAIVAHVMNGSLNT